MDREIIKNYGLRIAETLRSKHPHLTDNPVIRNSQFAKGF